MKPRSCDWLADQDELAVLIYHEDHLAAKATHKCLGAVLLGWL